MGQRRDHWPVCHEVEKGPAGGISTPEQSQWLHYPVTQDEGNEFTGICRVSHRNVHSIASSRLKSQDLRGVKNSPSHIDGGVDLRFPWVEKFPTGTLKVCTWKPGFSQMLLSFCFFSFLGLGVRVEDQRWSLLSFAQTTFSHVIRTPSSVCGGSERCRIQSCRTQNTAGLPEREAGVAMKVWAWAALA